MRTECDLVWERADTFVDRRINPDKSHIWPFRNPFAVDVRFLILDRRTEVPLHRPDHLEVVLFESGEQLYEVESNIRTLTKGDVIIVGDRISHRCLPLGCSQRPARTVVLSFLPQTVHSGIPFGDDLQYLMPFHLQGPSLPNVIHANPVLSREIRELIERIRPELPGSTERSRLAIRTYLKMILLGIVNHCSEMGTLRHAYDLRRESFARLAPVFNHLKDHYDEPIRVKDAARMCAASPCCFMNLFKELTGQSFVVYLNSFRVAKAQELLATTSKSIAEISLETGFCNQSYFTVVFRRTTGKTPLAYRLQGVESYEPTKFQMAVNPPSTVKMPPTQ
jgi:AraC family transcriptional activator of pobA